MSTELATEYADSVSEGIWENDSTGSPFGIVSDDNPVTDRDNDDDVTAMDYLSDVLDIQYIVDSDRTYRAARILVGFGGPNVWINTQTGNLEVSWWSETIYRSLPSEFIRELDYALAEFWDMGE